MHRKLYSLFMAGLLLLNSPVQAQEHDAQADFAMNNCDAIAQIYETVVCREDIELSAGTLDDMQAEYEANGLNPQQALSERRYERVANTIWEAALRHEFGDTALSLVDADITAYSEAFKAELDKNYASDKQTLEQVNALLATGGLSPEQRRSIGQLKITLQTSIKFYEQRVEQRNSLPPEFLAMMAETEHEMAAGFLRQWNIAQLLYGKYGGDVVSVSGRLEPVDAYLTFLDDIEIEESFKIYDSEYENALDIIRGRWTEMKNSKKATQADAKAYFSSPLHQFED